MHKTEHFNRLHSDNNSSNRELKQGSLVVGSLTEVNMLTWPVIVHTAVICDQPSTRDHFGPLLFSELSLELGPGTLTQSTSYAHDMSHVRATGQVASYRASGTCLEDATSYFPANNSPLCFQTPMINWLFWHSKVWKPSGITIPNSFWGPTFVPSLVGQAVHLAN